MTEPSEQPPERRRGLPADARFMAPVATSRGVSHERITVAASPRKTTSADASPENRDTADVGRSPRTWVTSALVSVALLLVVLLFAWPRSTVVPPVVLPTPSSTVAHTPSRSPSSPVSPSNSPSSPSSSTQPTESLTRVVDRSEPAAPLPGTVPPETPTSAPAEPPPTALVAAGEIQLDDAQFMAPEGWTLYGDELIENARRVVRLSHQATDVRLQAVTLEPSGADISTSCGSLVTTQQAQFTHVTPELMAPIGVDVTLGAAIRCGFAGIRSSDGVPNSVTFTLVTRASDSHVLVLRNTVPDALTGERTGVAQLNAMTCEASGSFGVALPLC